ncbi:pyocin S6 family toxin immunity protein [Pseudomonas gingeri]|uniref:Uncharacterized protein n=1 Tax=Pseudomonas gingeri TaxID=117681 RepID=A0A7Y7WKW5_9PSED|nr:pyocin S6 family toxin immunity protein [Pseudomonas gingeri]NWB50618.1 hypothetical protein [Pseudomonas gingeri]
MNLCISGFLPEGNDDEFIKYDLDVEPEFESELLELLGHASLNDMAVGEWPLTLEQVQQISAVIKQKLPLDLDLFIGVVA